MARVCRPTLGGPKALSIPGYRDNNWQWPEQTVQYNEGTAAQVPAWICIGEGEKLYLARIYVTLKPAVNDPQGQTVLSSLKSLGFAQVYDVRMGKYLELRIDEADRSRAEAMVADMCRKLLSNPVIEEFSFELHESPSASGPSSS